MASHYQYFISDFNFPIVKFSGCSVQLICNDHQECYKIEMHIYFNNSILYFEPVHGELYSIQHYVMKFVSDFRQVIGFLRFPPPTKLTATI